jgi:hypothetical protein
VYELFRGSITVTELDWSEAQIQDFVASRKSVNPHLCTAVGLSGAGLAVQSTSSNVNRNTQ